MVAYKRTLIRTSIFAFSFLLMNFFLSNFVYNSDQRSIRSFSAKEVNVENNGTSNVPCTKLHQNKK